MKTPAQRVRLGACVLAAIVTASIVVYRFSGAGFGWAEALWFVVITVSSVGLAEQSQLPPLLQLFTVIVIIFGMSAAAYTFGGFVQMMTEGEIERALGRRRMTRGIEQLEGHIVLCGFGRTGHILGNALELQQRPFVVVEHDPENIEEATRLSYLVVLGDATEEKVLLSAGVERASTLVTVLPNDAANVFIALTSRNLNPDLQIIARAEFRSSEKKLIQAGADRVVMPATIGAQRMARMITRPTTAHLMELVSDHSMLDIEMDEMTLSDASQLVGVTVADAGAHRRHGLLFVAVQHADGNMLFNPGGDYMFQASDTVIVMGRTEDIKRFQQQHAI